MARKTAWACAPHWFLVSRVLCAPHSSGTGSLPLRLAARLPENLSADPDFFQLDSLDGFTRHFKKTVFLEEAGGWHLLEMTHLGAVQDL